jgi:hypothetical protein
LAIIVDIVKFTLLFETSARMVAPKEANGRRGHYPQKKKTFTKYICLR